MKSRWIKHVKDEDWDQYLAEYHRDEVPLMLAAPMRLAAPVKWRDKWSNAEVPIYDCAGIDGFTRPICTLLQTFGEEARERETGKGWWQVWGPADDTVGGRAAHPLHRHRFESYQLAWAAIESKAL